VSSSAGCPVRCRMCDAGSFFKGFLTGDEMLAQIHHLVRKRFGGVRVPVAKFKIQFARMGEPAFNPEVLNLLSRLPEELDAEGLMPCISTIAPAGSESFMNRLTRIKNRLYARGNFQLQISIHTTDETARDFLMPVRKLSFAELSEFGEAFHSRGDRKITLNFAAARGFPIDARVLERYFDPARFLVKITPLNPTRSIFRHGLKSLLKWQDPMSHAGIERELRRAGYEVIISYGEEAENEIMTNCGQFASCDRILEEIV